MASFWAGILIIHHHSICHDLWHLVLIHCGGLQPSPSLALSLRWWWLRQKSFMMLERYNRLQSCEIDKHVKKRLFIIISLDMLDHFDSFYTTQLASLLQLYMSRPLVGRNLRWLRAPMWLRWSRSADCTRNICFIRLVGFHCPNFRVASKLGKTLDGLAEIHCI